MDDAALLAAIREHAYLEGDFLLRSGKRSSYYLDKFRFETRPELLEALGARLAATIAEIEPDAQRIACPVVGAVCMDMLMVDVTDVADVALGDRVTLIGRDGADEITADAVAAWAGTISYEILCGISKRVPRIYTGGQREPGTSAAVP